LVPGALFPLPPPDGLPVVLGLPPAPVTPPLLPFPPPPPFVPLEPPLLAVNICPFILVYCKKGAFCAFMVNTVLLAKSCIQIIHLAREGGTARGKGVLNTWKKHVSSRPPVEAKVL